MREDLSLNHRKQFSLTYYPRFSRARLLFICVIFVCLFVFNVAKGKERVRPSPGWLQSQKAIGNHQTMGYTAFQSCYRAASNDPSSCWVAQATTQEAALEGKTMEFLRKNHCELCHRMRLD